MNAILNAPKVRVSTGWPCKVSLGAVAVKVYKVNIKGTLFYQVADKSTGKRKLKTYPEKTAAVAEASRLVKLLASGEVFAASFSNEDTATFGRASELLRGTGCPLEVAAAIVAEACKILGDYGKIIPTITDHRKRHPETMPEKPVADVVTELLATKEGRASKRHLEDLRARLNKFAEAFKTNIATITGPDVQRWLDGMKKSPQTVKNYRTVAHQLFQFAERRGYIAKGGNPVADTEMPEIKGGKIEIYTPAELGRLLAAAPANFMPALAIGAFAGLRSAEIERLTWEEIDLAGGHITVAAEKAKTASRRIVPVVPALAAWLADCAKKSGPVWTGNHEEFYDAQKATAAAASLTWKANALRHSFISYRLADIQNAAQVALEAGNSAQVIFKHYRELVKPSAAAAWFAIRPEQPANVIPANLKTA